MDKNEENFDKIRCTVKEVQKIIQLSDSTAAKYIRTLRFVLDKPRPKIVTMGDFVRYYMR